MVALSDLGDKVLSHDRGLPQQSLHQIAQSLLSTGRGISVGGVGEVSAQGTGRLGGRAAEQL